jgi:hypothetical protein
MLLLPVLSGAEVVEFALTDALLDGVDDVPVPVGPTLGMVELALMEALRCGEDE